MATPGGNTAGDIKSTVDAGVNAIFKEYQCCCCSWLINGCWF